MKTETIFLTARTTGACDFVPTLDCYIPSPTGITDNKPKKAIIICPGGGYHFRAAWEAEPYALCFAAAGVAAFVLNYSVAPAVFPQSLCEAAEAVRVVRTHAQQWGIDPDKIVICGSSAGGHLAASLGTMYDSRPVLEALGGEAALYRPNGMLLCYPVITGGAFAHQGSFQNLLGSAYSSKRARELSIEHLVCASTPPTFLWTTFEDETVPAENSILMLQALRRNGVSCEFHLFPHGNHGLALASPVTATPHDEACVWTDLAIRWLRNL